MTPELERAVKAHNQWFGSYKKSGELVKIQVWLTVNNGCIEFLTSEDHSRLSGCAPILVLFATSAVKMAHPFPALLKLSSAETPLGTAIKHIGKHIRS